MLCLISLRWSLTKKAKNCQKVGSYCGRDEGWQLQVFPQINSGLSDQHIFACLTSSIGRAEVLANMDDNGSAYTSKDMFAGCKSDVDFVQVRRNSPAGLKG